MTGQELKELTESILDGLTLDDDFFIQLLNIAKNNLEGERVWEYLKKVDATQTASSGNNYNTAKTLPTDFALDYKVQVGSGFANYKRVPFDDQFIHRNTPHRFYIDVANSNYYLLGSCPGGTIYFFYKRRTDPITLTSSPVFPEDYHPFLAFMVAGYYQVGVDADDTFARMSPENKTQALLIRANMIQWDTDMKVNAQDGIIGVADSDNQVDLSQM